MTGDELLRAGIAAARAGDLDQAASFFAQLVRQDPSSEKGWLGLGSCSADAEKREHCFRRVLAINPNNAVARQQLERMGLSADLGGAAASSRSIPGLGIPTASAQPAATASPFLPEEQSAPFGAGEFEEYKPPELPSLPAISPSEAEGQAAGAGKPQRKKITTRTAVFGSVFVFMILAGACVGYLWFSGSLAGLFPASNLPTQMATVAVPPTVTPTPRTPTATVPTFTPTSTPVPTMRPTVAYTATIEAADCWFDKPPGVKVDCGYVQVPEDRTDPESPIIDLAFALFHSTSANHRPEPVMFLQGGPGGEAVMLSGLYYEALVQPFIQKYDFIAYDQRGTGLSDPALGCDELKQVFSQDIHGALPESSRSMIYENALRSCHGLMTVTDIDLNQYNTLISAADVRDVLLTLGYQQVNLYGASYGTRLAQVVMRDYPEIVRASAMDSVVPIEAKIYNDDYIGINNALNELFEACAADSGCNAAYPNLKTVFWDTVATLDENPLTISTHDSFATNITQTVTGAHLIWYTLGMLKNTSWIGEAPAVIYEISRGDYVLFEDIQAGLPFMFEGIDVGLYISVMCREHVMTTTPAELQASLDAGHDLGLYHLPFLGDAQDIFDDCKVWGSRPPYASENQPLVSDIPSLIIAGSFDPTTPPFYGQQIAARLSRHTYVEFPNMGHCPTASDSTNCAMSIVVSFFDHPETGPDVSCVDRLKPVEFLLP